MFTQRTLRFWLMALAATLAVGCSTRMTLTAGGTTVRHFEDGDAPSGCHVLSDVAIGIPPDAARPRTRDELVILMRNKAAEHGGNGVIVESEVRQVDSGGQAFWRGRGRAYACEETAAVPEE